MAEQARLHDLTSEIHVLDRVQVVGQCQVLEDGLDTAVASIRGVGEGDRLALEQDRPGIGLLDPGEDPHQRRLAGAVVAGKSTLVRILSGVEQADAGTILFEGKPITLANPTDARDRGIETVFQDLALANHLDPIQNMYLGREVMKAGLLGHLGFMERAKMRSAGREAFTNLGATVNNFSGPVGGMSGGQRQAIAVARAATWAGRVILLDEPTAALGVVQTKVVLDLIRRIRDKGIGVVLI